MCGPTRTMLSSKKQSGMSFKYVWKGGSYPPSRLAVWTRGLATRVYGKGAPPTCRPDLFAKSGLQRTPDGCGKASNFKGRGSWLGRDQPCADVGPEYHYGRNDLNVGKIGISIYVLTRPDDVIRPDQALAVALHGWSSGRIEPYKPTPPPPQQHHSSCLIRKAAWGRLM